MFVTEARNRITALRDRHKKVIVDGAIAKASVVRRIFDGLPGLTFIYFHPHESSAAYLRNLTSRFNGATTQNHNGLPKAFWKYIDQDAFAHFCLDRVITPQLEQSISSYAQYSALESTTRLKALQREFPLLMVVDV